MHDIFHDRFYGCKYCISSVIRPGFPFQNDPRDLDPSYMMDQGLWACLERETPISKLNYMPAVILEDLLRLCHY